jgi:large subunit ribosomal protein L7Ae
MGRKGAKGKKGKVEAKKPANWKEDKGHLFKKDARDFGIGRDVMFTRDLSRFVKWPRYVRVQRQRAILKKRLKVPPAINQFNKTLEKNQASTLFRLLSHYRPESREEKKNRLKAVAEAEIKDVQAVGREGKPNYVKYGLQHVTSLIESKKAKLVVIAHDVEPIELVVWLPALCRKMDVPYCIVKGKARLGYLVHKKFATCLAITDCNKEDKHQLDSMVNNCRSMFNESLSDSRQWGIGVMGHKTQATLRKREKAANAAKKY